MNRNPPQKVQKILRKEVNFVCPVPGCTNSVLTWHHFDPPWHVENHHEPKGMIALCPSHHPLADGGNWSKAELRKFKKNPQNSNSIRKTFLWSDAKVLYRLGGNYAANTPYILTISGVPIIWNTTSSNSRILFSIDLRDQQDTSILLIKENSLSTEYNNIDDLFINTYENHLKVWLEQRKIGLELRLRHLSIKELTAIVDKDASKAFDKIKQLLPENQDFQIPKPDISFIMDYATKECLNSDKKVALLDFVNATLYGGNRCVMVRNGVVSGSELYFNFSHSNGKSAFAF